MSNNQRREQGKQNQNMPKRPIDQHQKERINPNQRPQEGGFNREAAGQHEWKRPEQRPNQGGKGGQGNQGGRQQPGQGGQKGGNLGNNYGREDRR